MRRTPTLLAALAVASLVAAACGGDDDATTTTAAPVTTEPATTEPATTEPVTTEPVTTEPATTEPMTTDPALGGTITVYSGRGEDLVGPLMEMFTDATGIDVEVRYGNSAEMLLLIQEEGGNSPADVYYSQGAGFLGELSSAGGLLELDAAVLELVPEQLRSPADDWVGTSGRARVVVYNTDELTEGDLPDSILGFTEPEWNGRIGYAPTNASFQDFVTAMRAIEGEEATRGFLEGLLANGAVPYENNTAIVEAVAAGEVSVGLTNHYYLFRYLAEDPDYPAANKFYSGGDVGALINIAGAGVVATTDQPAESAALIEYLLSPEAQTYFAEQTFEIPVVAGVEPPVELPALDSLELPSFDLNQLLDLQGTIDLLTDVGML
jgi:iron(III) transport system substrate-binding protein